MPRAHPKIEPMVGMAILPQFVVWLVVFPLGVLLLAPNGQGLHLSLWRIVIPVISIVWVGSAWLSVRNWNGYKGFGLSAYVVPCEQISPIAHVRFDDIVMIEARVVGGGARVVGALSDRTGVARGVTLVARNGLAVPDTVSWCRTYPSKPPEIELILDDGSGKARLVASLDIDVERNPRTDWVEAPKGVPLPSRVLDMLGPSFEHTNTSSHRWFCETIIEVGDTITVIAFLDAQEGDVFRRPGVLELGADVVDCAFLGTAEELRAFLAAAIDFRRNLKLAYGAIGGILLLAAVIVQFL